MSRVFPDAALRVRLPVPPTPPVKVLVPEAKPAMVALPARVTASPRVTPESMARMPPLIVTAVPPSELALPTSSVPDEIEVVPVTPALAEVSSKVPGEPTLRFTAVRFVIARILAMSTLIVPPDATFTALESVSVPATESSSVPPLSTVVVPAPLRAAPPPMTSVPPWISIAAPPKLLEPDSVSLPVVAPLLTSNWPLLAVIAPLRVAPLAPATSMSPFELAAMLTVWADEKAPEVVSIFSVLSAPVAEKLMSAALPTAAMSVALGMPSSPGLFTDTVVPFSISVPPE